MIPPRLAEHAASLAGLARRGRGRRLLPAAGVDFSSNDYLGLAASPGLADAVRDALERGAAVGSGGSRLLRGNNPEHEALEADAARFFGASACLFFATGHAANAAIFSALPRRGDLVVHDALIHASVHDGLALGRATFASARHGEVADFDRIITDWRVRGGRGRPWIAVESVYSMDGDLAPLDDLVALADRHDGFLVIDEAHATGVHGPGGRGLAAAHEGRENIVVLHTCGKALGVSGALVAAHPILIDTLVDRARSFLYSTAPSPIVAAAVRAALRIVASEPWRREALFERVALAQRHLGGVPGFVPTGSQILPVVIGDNARAVRVSERMRDAGWDVRAIRPPTVPEGTARLRFSITLNAQSGDIVRASQDLARIMAEVAQ